MQNEVENLKKKRHVQVVVSSPSSPHNALSAGSSYGLGISSKQGRKTDAEIKGRSTNFEEVFAELNDSENAQAKNDDAEIKGRKLDFDDIDIDADADFEVDDVAFRNFPNG